MSGSTAATLMLAEGWDMKVVAQLLGHASVTTTSRYLDELPGELSVAVNAHP
ncbi:tyrosine-type recombinase/integrase [Kocuria sp. KH4]